MFNRVLKGNIMSNKIVRHLHSNITHKNLKLTFFKAESIHCSFLAFQVLIMQSQEHFQELVKGKNRSNLKKLSSED